MSQWINELKETINQVLDILKLLPTSTNVENWTQELGDFETTNVVKTISIALVGHVGSGKSSLINALLNIEECTPTDDNGSSVTETVVEISSSSNYKYEAIIHINRIS